MKIDSLQNVARIGHAANWHQEACECRLTSWSDDDMWRSMLGLLPCSGLKEIAVWAVLLSSLPLLFFAGIPTQAMAQSRAAQVEAGAATGSKPWTLASAIVRRKQSFSLEPELMEGPFEISATVVLEEVGGTAASVWFGDQINFGFDGRSGTLFVEGSLIRGTKLLQPTGALIQAGQPFEFTAMRDVQGKFSISINRQPVFLTDQLRGRLGAVRFRPFRNRVSLLRASVKGAFRVRPEGIRTHPIVTPILADGSQQAVTRFELTTQRRRRIRQLTLELAGTTEISDIECIVVIHVGDVNRELARIAHPAQRKVVMSVDHWLEPGTNEFSVACRVDRKSNLMNLVQILPSSIQLEGRSTDEKVTWKPDVTSAGFRRTRPQRLARCIHQKHQDGCHTFRIPAIARTPAGTLLAVYDMRYNSARDLQEDIDIGLSRSTDGGQTWSKPKPIMDMGKYGGKPEKENGCSDPGILIDQNTGEIFVSAVWTHGKPNTHQWTGRGSEPGFEIGTTAQFMVVRSLDDGQTWGKPENWTRRLKQPQWWLFAPAPGNGITLKNGTLVMPTQGRDENGLPFSGITFSHDHGKSWTVSNPARQNTTECAVAELSDGRLMLNMRDNRNRALKHKGNGRAISTTSDLGKDWQVHSTDHAALPEPVCMASLIQHQTADEQTWLLFSNPNHTAARKRMTIQLSKDDGETWKAENRVVLDDRGGAYSSLVMVDEKTVGILYESSVADLVFQKIKLDELLSGR